MITARTVRASIAGAALILAFGASPAGTVDRASPDPSQRRTLAGEPAAAASPAPDAAPSISIERLPPDDLFTAPADPLSLSLSLAKRNTSKVIGAKGGRLDLKGPDGTRYRLTIPEGALPMRTPISMVAVTDASGFPDGTEPESTVGVELTPSGLELIRPATLRIQPPGPPPAIDSAVLSAGTDGNEVSFHHFDTGKRAVTLELDHFSSYFMVWPLPITEARAIARRQLTSLEARYASVLASYLRDIRQAELRGERPFYSREEVIDAITDKWRRDVLGPRLAVAGQGCLEAQDAIIALTTYGRQMAIHGYADIPIVDMVEDYGWVPKDLVQSQIRLCFKEAFEFCTETGDLPGLVAYYYDVFSRGEEFLGYEPSSEEVALAHGYLGRCGRYRFKLSTSLRELADVPHFDRELEASREFHLQWEPGNRGGWGMIGATIKGAGDVEVTKLEVYDLGRHRVRNIANPVRSEAEVTFMTLYRHEVPLIRLQLGAVPPELVDLSIYVNLGKVTYTAYRTGHSVDTWTTFAEHAGLVDPDPDRKALRQRIKDWATGEAAEVGLFTRQLPKGTKRSASQWRYRTKPLGAVMVLEEEMPGVSDSWKLQVRLEAIFEHDPQ